MDEKMDAPADSEALGAIVGASVSPLEGNTEGSGLGRADGILDGNTMSVAAPAMDGCDEELDGSTLGRDADTGLDVTNTPTAAS